MIRIGLVGGNHGGKVLLPAFRMHARCAVVALAGTDEARTAHRAGELSIEHAFGDWRDLVEHPEVDAVAIAAPPAIQPAIAARALQLGKPVFAQKPMAADLAGAAMMLDAALTSRLPAMIDFNFTGILEWRRAKELLEQGAIGRLRHAVVNWNVESYAARMGLRSWKTNGAGGGGTLGNYVSHCLHYLEWLCGPIQGMSARLSGLGQEASETTVVISFRYASGAEGGLAVSCASYLGSGHRVELYGEDGTLVLKNTSADYMRGFVLGHARRPASEFEWTSIDDPVSAAHADGRIAPTSRLLGRFLDAIEHGSPATPSFQEGYRVQMLLDAARRSHAQGCWTEVPSDVGLGLDQ